MAKLIAPFKISGKIGDLTSYKVGDHYFLRQAPFSRKFTAAYYQEHQLQFKNRYRFAGALATARQFYTALGPDFKRVARPHAHNLLRGRFRASQDLGQDTWTYDFVIAHFALHQLDLAPDSGPSSMLITRLIGPAHQPTHLHIDNLLAVVRHIRNQASIHGNADLQMRIQLCWVNFVPMKFVAESKKWSYLGAVSSPKQRHSSRWIPAHLLPEDGITLSARPKEGLPEDEPFFLQLLIEWREHRPVGDQYIPLHKQGTLRFLACQYSPEQQQQIDQVTERLATKAASAVGPEEAVSDLDEGLMGLL
ncbi:MAG: hypothetical protein U0176_01790 [Bacteroidia bacterium]